MIQITQKEAQELGLQPSIQASQDLGFTDFRKSSAFTLKNTHLDLENLGVMRKANPRLVIRKPVDYIRTASTNSQVWKSWRQLVETDHYFAKYQISTALVGQLSDVHFPLSYYGYQDNNFFKPYKEEKVVKRIKNNNDFNYARFRFPIDSSNTRELTIGTITGNRDIDPRLPGFLSKEEDRKRYYRWHPALTRFKETKRYQLPPGVAGNLSGFHVPYPNTLSIYEGISFSIPTKITTKFNSDSSQSLNGILVISTGNAEQKTICYVSPHVFRTGYLNTVEDIVSKRNVFEPFSGPGTSNLASVSNASWYGSEETGYLNRCDGVGYIDSINGTYNEASIPSENNTHSRFYNVNNRKKQIYFDHTIPAAFVPGAIVPRFGLSGRWCIAISGNDSDININYENSGVVYMHVAENYADWKKTDPRSLIGPWVAASGHPKAASGDYLNRAGVTEPKISQFKVCHEKKSVNTERLQIPSLILDSDGYVLPKGVRTEIETYDAPAYSAWRLSNASGPNESGFIINDAYVTMAQILQSGIQIPQQAVSRIKYTVDKGEHFKQDIPLQNTYFYKFYNQLYNGNKTIDGDNTWDGIIPSGVKVSVELVSTTLNSEFGIANDQNLAIVYSGYGNGDAIDRVLQSGVSRDGAFRLFPNPSLRYVVSGDVPWAQKRYPYKHAFNEFGQLTYTAFKTGPTEVDALNITKTAAIKKINNKILQLVNKILPTVAYKNKKWRRLGFLKSKLQGGYFDSIFSKINVPDSALPGATVSPRRRPYATGQA